MAGYFGMPEQTADAWRNGWFHTGDGLVQDERGRYHFVDRIKDSIRRRGENISSMEVEAFVNAHPAVAETVGDRACPRSTARTRSRCASSSTNRRRSRTPSCTTFLAARMPAFMVPRYIEYLDNPERTEAMQRIKKPQLREHPLNEHTWDAAAAE